jgi:hypothetical protein
MGLRRAAGTLASLALVAGSLVLASSGIANAYLIDDDGDRYLSVTGTVTSANLNVRAAPYGTIIDNLPNGYSNTVDCYVKAYDGTYWDYLYDTRIGNSGWVYDPYLYTGGNIYQQVDEMHEGNCGSIPLTPPANVKATAISTAAIRVTWTDTNAGTAQYVVGNGNTSSADLPAGTTSYTWSGLAPNTYMCFFVAAKQPGLQSAWSQQSCTSTWALSAPSSVTATTLSTAAIRVTWHDLNGGASQYVVGNGSTASADLAAGTMNYTWSGLAPNTYMCFFVAAKQSGQQSAWSQQACTSTWALSAPTSVTATPVSTTAIRIIWHDPNGGASQFVVKNDSAAPTVNPILAAGSTSYTWSGLAAGTSMCFFVAAQQSGQQSAWSAPACATTPTYVNMGDSFSSGEGTYGIYDKGTDNPGINMCHRSSYSYSGQFTLRSSFWHSVTNIACSGATTNDIQNPPGATNAMGIPTQGEPAQDSVLNNKTGLVTITIGGNNLNLAGIFTNCIKGGVQNHDKTDACFRNSFNDTYISEIPKWLSGQDQSTEPVPGPSLEQVYADIKAKAPNAKIVVSTYPQIFPATYTGDCTENVGLTPIQVLYLITSQDQLDRIHRVVDALNSAIKTAAAAEGLTVRDESNLFNKHEVCAPTDSWVNEVNGWSATAPNQGPDDESLHPTIHGYGQWAGDLVTLLG